MDIREELVKELKRDLTIERDNYVTTHVDNIIDFVIERDRKIVDTIINIVTNQRDLHSGMSMTRKGTCDEIIE